MRWDITGQKVWLSSLCFTRHFRRWMQKWKKSTMAKLPSIIKHTHTRTHGGLCITSLSGLSGEDGTNIFSKVSGKEWYKSFSSSFQYVSPNVQRREQKGVRTGSKQTFNPRPERAQRFPEACFQGTHMMEGENSTHTMVCPCPLPPNK